MSPEVITGFKMDSNSDGSPDISLRLDLSPGNLPPGMHIAPMKVRHDGVVIESLKIALSSDPDFLREAERDGFLGMSREEESSQLELNHLLTGSREGGTDEQQEIASLKIERIERNIDDMAVHRGETLLSALPKWHLHSKPTHQTKAAHKRRIDAFIDLHGNMALIAITRRHMVEFVRHLQTVMSREKPPDREND